MRVLVTRPQPGAFRTAERLKAAGHEAVLLPLTEVSGIAVKAASLPHCDAVAVTSANALRFTPRALLSGIAGKPLFAVGSETAASARKAGIDGVTEGPGDAAGLAALLASRLGAGTSLVYICGKVRHPAFETAARSAGIRVTPVETYDVSRVALEDAEVIEVIGDRAVDAVLLYSAVAAGAYVQLAGRAAVAPALGTPRIACLSKRIAAALDGEAVGPILVAATPDEAALLALLGP